MTYLDVLSIAIGSSLIVLTVGLCTCIKKTKSSIVCPDDEANRNSDSTDQLSCQAKKLASNRRLPEIPPSSVTSPDENFNRTIRRDSGQDAYSDLYAQLGNTGDPEHNPAKLPAVERAQARDSNAETKGSSTPPYAKIKKTNHPYSKIKKKAEREHPYASVKDLEGQQEGDETDTDSYDVIEARRSGVDRVDSTSSPSNGPAPPPRGRRPVTSFELGGPSSGFVLPQERPVSAAGEVEYNPAGSQVNIAGRQEGDGPHFSGDSQDSKGYSCITVRESLAVLRAKIAQENLPVRSSRPGALVVRQESMSDPNYATVSEAEYSENVYSAIPDPNGNLYNSSGGGSETYARVDQAPLLTDAVALPTEDSLEVDMPPEPPSVISLKHLSLTSRQGSMASMLSGSSSHLSLASPKPERRKANSPLPPPPSPQNDDMYATVNKVRRNSRSLVEHGRTAVKSLEEMYAKVLKRKSATLSRASDASFLSQSENSSHRGSIDLGKLDFSQETKKGHKKTGSSPSGGSASRRGSADTLGSRQSLTPLDHLRGFPSLPEEMNYETIKAHLLSDIQVSNSPSQSAESFEREDNDPGYEKVINEGYERIKSDHGYEAIRLNTSDRNYGTAQEPGYESVSLEGSNYECVRYDSRNEMYEELGSSDGREPNYESVKYFIGEPPYEQLGSVNNYEIVDGIPVSPSEEPVVPFNPSVLYSKVSKPKKNEEVNCGSISIHVEGPLPPLNSRVESEAEPSKGNNVVRIEVTGNSWTLL
ncbi:uncharacterized protein LOC136038660 [Artemia franciscana]|uniref:Uncharacterized protein n=1 Tax=Artemia franciscana TaxID=6661 RepID=A0AA88HWW6_ARTSF|nr:hypothetical protein QYM36_006202 [Artemia franciscana]KAK2717334.1 hypothetical protein QYM36_006202 [Artemia franciscana]KAK2717335.1 hypothetical protein QYM36_006202 [Artemia franciscana]